MVDSLVLPRAYDASRTWLGMACSPARTFDTTSGRATRDSIAPAAKNERPYTTPLEVRLKKPRAGLWNRMIPNRARTIDGVPAIISIADSATRASAEGRPYSLSHTAIAIPTGMAMPMASAVTTSVPSSGSRNPPLVAAVTRGPGW